MEGSHLPRRRSQFRLRTLLIGVTLLAIYCGTITWFVRDRQRLIRERDEANASPFARRPRNDQNGEWPFSRSYEQIESDKDKEAIADLRRRVEVLEQIISQQSAASQKP